MKYEIGGIRPGKGVEQEPGRTELFAWLERMVTVPNLVSIITTLDASGVCSSSMNAWGMIVSDYEHYTSIVCVSDPSSTCFNIQSNGEWCHNIPSSDYREVTLDAVLCSVPEHDDSGDTHFAHEPARFVAPPRLRECPISLECRLLWHRPLCDGSSWHIFAGKVVHAAIDSELAKV